MKQAYEKNLKVSRQGTQNGKLAQFGDLKVISERSKTVNSQRLKTLVNSNQKLAIVSERDLFHR